MVALSIMAAMQIAVPESASGSAALPRDLVVIGRRASNSERVLAACIERSCPPDQEIEATLLHAEDLFLAGEYQRARSVLLKGRRRNNRFGERFPLALADLNRANARLASLNGLTDSARIGTVDTLTILRRGFGKQDTRVLVQRLEVGDLFARQGRERAATDVYAAVEKQARDAGLRWIEGLAMFRTAALYGAIASVQPSYRSSARRAAARISATSDADMEPFRQGVLLMQAKLAALDGKDGDMERIIAALKATPATQPMLVDAPPIDYPPLGIRDLARANKLHGGDVRPCWIDVGFWVAQNGTVRQPSVLRRSCHAEDDWIEPVLTALRGRRYAPLAIPADHPGVARIERFSLIHDRQREKGSRVPSRTAAGRIERVDLTGGSAPALQPVRSVVPPDKIPQPAEH